MHKSYYEQLKQKIATRGLPLWEEMALWYELKANNSHTMLGFKTWKELVESLDEPINTVAMKVKLYELWIIEIGMTIDEMSQYSIKKLNVAKSNKYMKHILEAKHGNKRQAAETMLRNCRKLSFSEFKEWLSEHYDDKK